MYEEQEQYPICPLCGTENYSNVFKLRLIDISTEELETIDEYIIGYDLINPEDYEIVCSILERDVDYREVEVCCECGGELE
jgi:hypothetical protein